MLTTLASAAAGQSLRTWEQQSVIVGLLTGMQDRRELTIRLSSGTYQVAGSGDSRPFEVIENDEHQIVVALKNSISTASAEFDPQSGRHPSRVIYRYFSTERSLVTAIILDEIDYAVFNGESMVREIAAATNKFRLLPVRSPANTVQMVCYNMAHPIFRDRRVRQALSYAINHGKIKKHLLADKADIVRGPFEKESPQYASGMNEFKYNPKMAIALLKSAGWKEVSRDGIRVRNGRPLRFQLFFGEGLNLDEQVVRQIRIDCIQIGIEVEPVPLSAAALNDSLRRGKFEAALLQHRFEESAEALIDFFGDGRGKGFMSYRSSSFRHVVNLIRRLRKPSEIRTAVMRMQLVLNQDQPATFLFHPWLVYYVINAAKFESFLGSDGLPKPFEEWLIRRTP